MLLNRKPSNAKRLLFNTGIKEDKTVNCMNDNELVIELKKKVKKFEFPIIEIKNRFIGNLNDLTLIIDTLKKEIINGEIVNDYSDEENSQDELLDNPIPIEKQEEQKIENKNKIEENTNKNEVQVDDKELVQLIESKQELIENKKKELINSPLKVNGLFSYPMHLVETGYKSTLSGIYSIGSYLWGSKNQNNQVEKYIQFPVLKTNWYGRVQKRSLRFYPNRIERLDEHNNLRQVHFFKDISEFVITDSDFFYLIVPKNTQELYQTPSILLNDLLDLFNSTKTIFPNLVIKTVKENEEEKK